MRIYHFVFLCGIAFLTIALRSVAIAAETGGGGGAVPGGGAAVGAAAQGSATGGAPGANNGTVAGANASAGGGGAAGDAASGPSANGSVAPNGGSNSTAPNGIPNTTLTNGGAGSTTPNGGPNPNIPNGGTNPTPANGGPGSNVPNGGPNPNIPNAGANSTIPTTGTGATTSNFAPRSASPNDGVTTDQKGILPSADRFPSLNGSSAAAADALGARIRQSNADVARGITGPRASSQRNDQSQRQPAAISQTQQQNFQSSQVPSNQSGTPADPSRWRFTYNNGEWWYWTPQNNWMYYRDNTWNSYDASAYRTNRSTSGYRGTPDRSRTSFYTDENGRHYRRDYTPISPSQPHLDSQSTGAASGNSTGKAIPELPAGEPNNSAGTQSRILSRGSER
jgi:hypothetical protein